MDYVWVVINISVFPSFTVTMRRSTSAVCNYHTFQYTLNSLNLVTFFHNFFHLVNTSIYRSLNVWYFELSRVSGLFSQNLISIYWVYFNELFLFELPREFQGTEHLLQTTKGFEYYWRFELSRVDCMCNLPPLIGLQNVWKTSLLRFA